MDYTMHDSESNGVGEKPPSPSSSSSPPHPFTISRLHPHSHSIPRRSSSPIMPISLTTTSSTTSIDRSPPHGHPVPVSIHRGGRSPSPQGFISQSFNSPSGRRLSTGLSCVVCGDTSSGKHYGILACNGCSGFFKRSVRRKLIYRCQAGTGSCIVDKAHRNQCQACRLKKCLNMGMNKDAVQNERQPRNTATLRPESLCEMDQERALREAAVAVGVFGCVKNPNFIRPLLGPRHANHLAITGGGGTTYHHPTHGHSHHSHGHPGLVQVPSTAPQPMILSSAHSNESINENDDDEDSIDVTSDDNVPTTNRKSPVLNHNGSSVLHQNHNNNNNNNTNHHNNNRNSENHNNHLNNHHSNPNTNNTSTPSNNGPASGISAVHSTTITFPNNPSIGPNSIEIPSAIYNPAHETIYETSARLLFMAVKWAKNLPSFGSLPFRDQVILLEEAWADLFLLNAIQWCMPGDSISLFSSTDHLNHIPNGKATQVAVDLRILNDALLRFRAIGVDPAEFACLKAIALFKSDTRGLKDPLQVENLQDQAQVMLCQHSRGQHPTQAARFGRLLLMLPLLRSVPAPRIELLFFQRTIGNTPMEKVLCDMYKN